MPSFLFGKERERLLQKKKKKPKALEKKEDKKPGLEASQS